MSKCEIEWVDRLPHRFAEAIAQTICYDPLSFGEEGSPPFFICEEHAKQKSQFWRLLPLPGKNLEDSHPLVQQDAKYFVIIPDVVTNSIRKNFPDHVERILQKISWNLGHFVFIHNEIYYGVELDGYIFT